MRPRSMYIVSTYIALTSGRLLSRQARRAFQQGAVAVIFDMSRAPEMVSEVSSTRHRHTNELFRVACQGVGPRGP